MCTEHKQSSHIAVAVMGNRPEPRYAARGVLFWCESDGGCVAPSAAVYPRISDGCHQCGGGLRSNRLNLH
jgi:hypothetical protein